MARHTQRERAGDEHRFELDGGVDWRSAEPRPAASVEVNARRDRMAALLARYHGYVARVGGWLWGLDAAAHVPPLRARSVASRDAPPTAEPPPVAPA